ncbi:hypothetical protein Ade02nite_24490 [Paractinoplanes deccanensis]|uniref:Uncharacterized protein n=1 Tax=Paractinoplanes deccanensis TaxID=113561 RepID=A0ABQ3Y1C7_9ACTN|nr:hypothetical protein [Actinoplanes deccanensis]GID73808.1 hypothetical protein Ade02nite_24490 [Actinoplanes deccanensis]
MATISLRGALLRSLPALLLLLTLGLVAPAAVAGPVTAGVTHSTSSPAAPAAGSTADTPESPDAAPARTPGVPVADRTRVLSAQHTAGARGSRAPPSALA